MIKKLTLFCTLVHLGLTAHAYPEFIGIGYSSCLTCHYNGSGNGSLNDYGRALFAAEIAAKPPWSPNAEDDALGESSGFLGKTEMPDWLRPSIKYRGLSLTTGFGKANQKNKNYDMQEDVDLVLLSDSTAKYLVSFNFGVAPSEAAASPLVPLSKNNLVSREQFLRAQVAKGWFVYLGLMDKVFGIKHPDHTAVNRSSIGIGQNDQVHGGLVQWTSEQIEAFVHVFKGNLRQKPEAQLNGTSVLLEADMAEKKRIGISLLAEKNETLSRKLTGLIAKIGLGDGHSFLAELGTADKQLVGLSPTKSFYAFSQGTMKLKRGLFLQSVGQYQKSDMSAAGAETLNWSLGFLYFPVQRFEFRLNVLQSKYLNSSSVPEDNWNLLTQVHISL